MPNKKETTSIYTSLMQYLSIAYIGYLLIAFVLGYHEQYFDIAQAKRTFFIYGTSAYIIPMLFLYGLDFLHSSTRKFETDALLCTFLLLMASWIIGLLWNINRSESFWGTTEKCTGLLLYLVAGFAILFLSKYFCWNGMLSWIYLFSCIAVYLLQILNRFSIDPLLMYENLVARQVPAFLSTLGHINYNASFNCIMLSINLILFINSRQKLSKVLYGLCLFLGYAGSICCNSESVYLGILLAFLFCIGYCLSHSDSLKLVWIAGLMFFLASLLIYVLYAAFPAAATFPGEVTIALSPYALLTEALLLVLGLFFIKFILHQSDARIHLFQKVWVGFLIILLACSYALPFIFAHNDAFATGRGLIWRKCLESFKTSSIWHQLFGYGFNNIRLILEMNLGNAFDISGTDVIMDAHNILLNTLLTSGIIGCLLWLAFLILLLKRALQQLSTKPNALFVIVGVGSYLIQGLFNGPQIITTPIFLIELGIFWRIIK